MSLLHLLLIFSAGIGAGFINVIAGGGSLLTMPILIFLGLPSATANGTNRIALMAQNVVAISSFKKKGFFDWKLGLLLSFPAIIGSIFGANLAIELSDELFNRILSIVMIFVLVAIVFKPHKKINQQTKEMTCSKKLVLMLLFLLVGFYGGFIQAGVGFVIIAFLSLFSSLNLIQINSLKVFIVAFYTISSLLIFLINDQVHWLFGISLAIGTSIGGYLGSHFAVSKGEKWIRYIMIVAVLAMSFKLWFT